MSARELGRAALARRKVELDISQAELRARTGLSETTISKIEHGGGANKTTLRRLDVGLDWPVGTAQSWLDGHGGVVSEPATERGEILALVEELLPLLAERMRDYRRPETLSGKIAGLPAPIAVALEALVDQLLVALEDDDEPGGR